MTRQEIVRELCNIFMEANTITDALKQDAVDLSSRVSRDPDLPRRFEMSTLTKLTIEESVNKYQDTVMTSKLSDDELLQVLNWQRTELGQSWCQERRRIQDAMKTPRDAFSEAVAKHLGYVMGTKNIRMLVHAVHKLRPDMTPQQAIEFSLEFLETNPILPHEIDEETKENGERVAAEVSAAHCKPTENQASYKASCVDACKSRVWIPEHDKTSL